MSRRRLLLALAVVLLAGCGTSAPTGGSGAPAPAAGANSREPPSPPPAAPLSVALDFTPNAVHAPLFMAADTGADARHGLRLRIRQPGEGPDALKLLVAGKIDVGIIDIADLALARQHGVDVVGIGALVQRPLAALVGDPALRRPRDLDGKVVGVSGLPSDPAFLKAVVEADGGDYASIRQVTIGFNAVGALLARKVDAVPVFWNAEGVALRHRGRRTSEFRVERYGAPAYPEVVFMARRDTIRSQPERLKAFLAAVKDGIAATRADPARATQLIATAAGSADRGLVRAQVDAVLPLLSPPVRLDAPVLVRWAAFAKRIGILERPLDVRRAFDTRLAP